MKSIIGGIVLAALISPAFADEYWVEYNYSTHECSIVEKKSSQSVTDATQTGPAANPTADVTASGAPNDGSTSHIPQGFAPPPKDMPPVVVTRTPSDANTPSITPDAPAPANTTTALSPTAPGAPTDTSDGENKDDPFADLAASWARKKAAAEAAGTADIMTAEIGTAMHSREDAENEMKVMRKCGINH